MAITKYAERLDKDLDDTTYLERIKIQQRNWIGISEGSEIDFKLALPVSVSEVVFASNNKGKLARMQKLFKAAGLSAVLKTPQEIGILDFDVIEDGKTLQENAEKKAKALLGKTILPILADDSGFFIHNEKIPRLRSRLLSVLFMNIHYFVSAIH